MAERPTTTERELERFRTIVEVAGEPIYTLNADGRFTYVNDALLAETGYTRAELLGEDVSLLLSETDLQRCEAAIAALAETDDRSRTVEIAVETADGEHRPAEVTLALLPREGGDGGDDGEEGDRDDEAPPAGGTVGVARPLE